jgi:UDP-N-acetylglucosamine 2-epimerase (non-hydrolysing)
MFVKKKILIVFGTRPEAIKMAPLCHIFKADKLNFETLICVTAQHREMLDQVLQIFDIVPDIDLNLMKPNQDLCDLTSNVLLGIKNVINDHRPDYILLHGDTTTMLASSLAAFFCGVKIVHIEAGLRTYNINSPFPEEANRQIASKIVDIHFSPTDSSRNNLIDEGVNSSNIVVTGNTVIDSLFWVLKKIDNNEVVNLRIRNVLDSYLSFDWSKNKFVLITGHRRENFGESFIQICEAIRTLAIKFPEINFVYPVHLNPKIQIPVNKILSGINNVHLIPPLEYEPFIYLLRNSYLVLTDSGGIQEEAPSLGKPVLVMRETTERPEAVTAGTVRLVGSNKQKIVDNVSELIEDLSAYHLMSHSHNPYGDGNACENIYNALKLI